MAKHGLQEPPIWRRKAVAVNAYVTVAFTPLAIGPYLQEFSGMSIKKPATTLTAIRSARIMTHR